MDNLLGLALTVMIAVILTWATILPLYNTYATLTTQNGSVGPGNVSSGANLSSANGVLSGVIPLLAIVIIVVYVARGIAA